VAALVQLASFQDNTSGAGAVEAASHRSCSPAAVKPLVPGPPASRHLSPSSPAAALTPAPAAAISGDVITELSVGQNGSSLKATLTPPTPGRGLLAAETAEPSAGGGQTRPGPQHPQQKQQQQQQLSDLTQTTLGLECLSGSSAQPVVLGAASDHVQLSNM